MKFVLSNAQVFDTSSPHHSQVVDILIEDGVIIQIGAGLNAKKAYDCKGMMITPGFCDLFAHLNEPGNEHKEDLSSGIKSAAFSGFTDVCVIPNTDPVIESKSDVAFIKSKARSGVDLHVIAAVSEGCKGENLTEILDLYDAGAIGFSDGLAPIWNSELLLKSLQYLHKFDGLLINRPKDVHLSQFTQMHEGVVSTMLGMNGEPSLSEELVIRRDLDILRYAGGRLHFSHLSSGNSVDFIKSAKKEGLRVSCDVAIHQLMYRDEDLTEYDSNLKVDPPFRTEKDRKALIKGLKDGVIDAIVSSHQPQDPESKELEFDLSSSGISSLPTLYSNLISMKGELPLEVSIGKVTKGPRDILGLPSTSIQEGSEAKIAVFDPERKWEFSKSVNPSKSCNSPQMNAELTGKCLGVFSGGQFFIN